MPSERVRARLDGAAGALELWGVHEIAQELGIRRETVNYHMGRPGFPEPVARLAMGPVWRAEDVREWRSRD